MNLFDFFKMPIFYKATIYICLCCMLVGTILEIKKNKNEAENENSNIVLLDNVTKLEGLLLFMYMLAFLVYLVIKLGDYTAIIYFPILILGFGTLILKPFISRENTKLISNYSSYASLSCVFCVIIEPIPYEKLLNFVSEKSVIELLLIFIFCLKVYLYSYIIIANVLNIFRMLRSLLVFPKKESKLFEEKLKIKYDITNKFQNKKGIRMLGSIIIYIYETFKNMLKLFIIWFYEIFILPILFIIKLFFKKIASILNVDDGKINFLVCKIMLIITFIVAYYNIITTNIFSSKTIMIFEYVSTAIIIPIALDSIISYKKIFNKDR